MPALPNPWRRLVYASHTMPVEFYSLLFLAIFGVFGLFFGSIIDTPRWDYTWIYLFVFYVKILLVAAPTLALIGIAFKKLFLAIVGLAFTGLNCLAYCAIAFILLFPHGGGFVIGGFLGLGIGYIRQVFNVTNMAARLHGSNPLPDEEMEEK